jgi:hypothetical protein
MHKKVPLVVAMLVFGYHFLFYDLNLQTENRETRRPAAVTKLAVPELAVATASSSVSGHAQAVYKTPTVTDNEAGVGDDDYYFELWVAYCKVKNAGVDIPLSGLVMAEQSRYYTADGMNSLFGTAVRISSDACPEGTYSEVKFNPNDDVTEVSDCRNTTVEAMVVQHGLNTSFTSIPADRRNGRIPLFINSGTFVKKCGPEIHYDREGRLWVREGVLTDTNRCAVLDREGHEISLEVAEMPDEKGCFANGQCIALVEPRAEDFKVLDVHTLLATGDPLNILFPEDDQFIHQDQVEQNKRSRGIGNRGFEEASPIPTSLDCAQISAASRAQK